MDTLIKNGFTITVDNQGIVIKKGEESFKFQPGEGANITRHLGLVARMASLPSLPAKLEQGTFTCFFQSDGTVGLFRTNEENGISFNIDQTDEFVDVLNTAVSKHSDFVQLRGGPRRGVAPQVPDPIIEGR